MSPIPFAIFPHEKLYILVMQYFRVGYRGICHASLVFSVYTRAFIPCLNLQKSYGNFGKSLEISLIFQKLRKHVKSVFEELKRFMKLLETSETVQKCFPDVFMIFKNFQKIFGNFRKCSEILGKLRKWFKSNFQMFL